MFRLIFIVIIILLAMGVKATSINISELSVEEKIGQMVIVKPGKYDQRFIDMGIGGILLYGKNSKEEYKSLIGKYQNNSRIKLFVSANMEGYWNPFSDFYSSNNFGEIKDGDGAYELGLEHGKIMKELGFNLDFSPVVEKRNTVWPGRSFTGSDEEINEKIKGYIEGLHNQSIMATAKHYPGGSMIKDPHLWRVKAEVHEDELELFDTAIKNDVDAVMVGHPVVYGALDSNGKPASVSSEVIEPLREKFDGLIITDAISMWGLRKNYLFRFDKVYIDLINAGNDVIIDEALWFSPWTSTPSKIKKRISVTAEAVRNGEIPEGRIDESMERILKAKGYEVVR